MARETVKTTGDVRAASRGSVEDLHLVLVASSVDAAVGQIVALSRDPVAVCRVAVGGAEDTRMSREHATAWRAGSAVKVRDGARQSDGTWKPSANGTTAAGRALATDEVTLGCGDTIITGRSLWMVVAAPRSEPNGTLLRGVSNALSLARDELELVVSQAASRLRRGERVRQALLVTGPRGTGKQVVANEARRMLGASQGSSDVPYRHVSAPNLSDGTVSADLFGVVSGYATDVKAREGYFMQADGGVLFLDEIGDTPVAEQAKLLTALQEREITPLGGKRAIAFNCLVIAATNRDLTLLADRGGVRMDLIDRLQRFHVHLPPLVDRPEDIPIVARALLARHGFTGGLPADVAEALLTHDWPGNVRQLDAVVERMVAICVVSRQSALDLAILERAMSRVEPRAAQSAASSRPDRATTPGREQLANDLERAGWNKSEVARLYGKHPRQITRWMAYLGIERPADA